MINEIVKNNKVFDDYYEKINQMIINSKTNIIRNINHEMVELYYNIGQAINELIDEYNLEKSQNEIIKSFSNKLTKEFGQGFSVPSLKKMKKFYQVFNGGSTLWNQLSWSHNRLIMNIDDEKRRNFYLEECIKSNWSVRQLERQINSGYYERYMLLKENLLPESFKKLGENPFLDSYVIEFLNLPNGFQENDLRKALIKNMKDFILELGKDFTFIDEEYKVQVGGDDFRIDLLFYHRGLQCLVAIELKIGKLSWIFILKHWIDR